MARPIGAGWSGFAAVNGFAVTMEQRGPDELVTCYTIATGEVQWAHALTARHGTIMGGVGPRATPTIHAGRVYALGATGVLRCLDGATGAKSGARISWPGSARRPLRISRAWSGDLRGLALDRG